MVHQQIIIVAGNTTITDTVTTTSILQCRCRGEIYFAMKEPSSATPPEVRYCTGVYDERYEPVYRYISRQLAKDETLDEVLLDDLKLKEAVDIFHILKGEELNKRKAAGEIIGDVYKLVPQEDKPVGQYVVRDDFLPQ